MVKVGDKIRILVDGPQMASQVTKGSICEVIHVSSASFDYECGGTSWGMTRDQEGICFERVPNGVRVAINSNDDASTVASKTNAAINSAPHKCSCVLRDLLMSGCKCGGV